MLAALATPGPAFTHIGPQHAGQQKAGRHRLAFADTAVGVLQRELKKRLVRRLDHHIEQRVNAGAQTEQLELLDAGQRMAGLQELEHFVEQARLRHVGQQAAHGAQRSRGLVFKLETQGAELGGKTHGADDAHRVFAVARGRVADHAQHAFFRVADAVVIVHHDLRFRVVVHGVDGEVTARRVVLHRAPDVVAQHAARRVHGVLHAGQLALAGALVAADLLGLAAVKVGAES